MGSAWAYPGMRALAWLLDRLAGRWEERQARRVPVPPRYVLSDCPDCPTCRLAARSETRQQECPPQGGRGGHSLTGCRGTEGAASWPECTARVRRSASTEPLVRPRVAARS